MDAGVDKKKALQAALAGIDKQFGKGAIMRLSADSTADGIGVISTGALNLDIALGIGGVPKGRVTEIYGPESSGKTTLCLHLVANVQRAGGVAAVVDAEHALDTGYAAKLGVDVDNLLISQPDNGEAALGIVELLVNSGAVDLIVVDSVAALVPKAEIEGDMGDSHVGLQARLMSQALRKLTGSVARTGTAVVFINQLREKIGVMFGSPETTTGGKALKFYASVRMDIRRKGSVKVGDEVVGSETRVKVVKNKMAPPFKEAVFEILYDRGIDTAGIILDAAVENGFLIKSGAWYALPNGGAKIGQGRESARAYVRENPEFQEMVKTSVLNANKKITTVANAVDVDAGVEV